MNQSDLILIALGGFWLSIVLFKIAMVLAPRLGLVDKPDQSRKNHEGSIPLIGGLIIVPVFAILCYIAGIPSIMALSPLFGGIILMLAIGALDDRFNVLPWARFVIQIWLACYVVVFCHAEIDNLGNLFGFGDVVLGYWGAKIFAVTCLVLLMNAINMLDGLDGLASGFILVALGWLMTVAHVSGFLVPFWAMVFLMVPLLAFMVFNARHPFRKKASIFLGDAGSLSLALIIGWFAIKTAQVEYPQEILSPVTIIWIMSVPIMDTFAIFFTRKKQGRSPFEADRMHAHYKLIDRGIDAKYVTPIVMGVAFVTGGIGYFGIKLGIPEYILLYTWSALLLGYTYYRIKKDGHKVSKK